MNKIVSFLFICLLLADLHAQNTIKIIDKDKTSTPVSPYLWGSFFEMGFGRSDLLWVNFSLIAVSRIRNL